MPPEKSSIFEELHRHFGISHETFQKLEAYVDAVLKWQQSINLISPDSASEIWHRHILDSLQLSKYLPSQGSMYVDVGSGAGFPAIPLAIIGYSRFHLVESDQKKATFLKIVSREFCPTVQVHQKRIETLILDQVSCITSRACASLASLIEISSQLVTQETICLFHKGKNYPKELEQALSKWQFQYQAIPSLTDAQGVILKLWNIHNR